MKINYILYLVLLSSLSLLSCKKDFLNQTNPNAIASSDYFESPNDVLLAVNGAYQALRNNNGMAEGSGLYSEERSDNTGRNDNQSNGGEPFQFNNFSILPTNSFLQSHWNALYSIVNAANFAIEGAESVTFSDQNLKNQYEAEAKFIRAITYFDLVRKWGAVPLVDKPVSSIEEAMAKNYRVSMDSVYSLIVSDLQYTINSSLPNIQSSTGIGHASKAAACGYLGKVYLTMASTLSADKKTENLINAKTYLEQSYAMRKFGTLSEIPYASVFDVNQKTTNAELLFQIEYKQGDQNYASSIAANNQAKGETINSLKNATGIGGNVCHDLVNDYELNDIRKAFSIKFASNVSVNDYFITKFRDTSSAAGTNGYGGNDWILLRYADVILMLAEVNNDLNNSDVAISYLDQVRTRAGLPSYEQSILSQDYGTKYPSLKLAILHERRAELAFENQRLYDLLRNFTPTEFAAYFQSKKQADYGLAQLANCGTKDYYYPIPFNDNKLNPTGLYQNPGY
ncbi:RagB/SusD family nutrient uptake outer membrane protein [Rhizosphaericola mali]|uniref:RagB/SusD family nutrient uptake outer membrane protein n=1 Tax=Rhizosphaericola mali TaxID=2545455 RepID=A0A5P2G218_9BACT|nr:RagB/SusD family nutrient uptake outer membrane protein [Rhizosphaericola mali]QES89844.1 RagB/SusD family nutrient uptake outer membrane protein [Rhizosphaericola mali]